MIKSLILFSHGARNLDWSKPFDRLRSLVQLELPKIRVELAFLELMEPNLLKLVARLAAKYIQYITIVPIFFGYQGHVQRDLPKLIDQLKRDYPNIIFHVAKTVGEDEKVLQALAQYCIDSATYSQN